MIVVGSSYGRQYKGGVTRHTERAAFGAGRGGLQAAEEVSDGVKVLGSGVVTSYAKPLDIPKEVGVVVRSSLGVTVKRRGVTWGFCDLL